MSHVVTGRSEITNTALLDAACRRLGLAPPVPGTFQLYGAEAEGLGVRLPNWKFPVVVNPETGTLRYDNYNGSWGKEEELDRLKQAYAVERNVTLALGQGYQYGEQKLADGSIALEIETG